VTASVREDGVLHGLPCDVRGTSNGDHERLIAIPVRGGRVSGLGIRPGEDHALDSPVGDFICVGENIYVTWMPKHLVTAHEDIYDGRISREALNAKLESRKEFLCKEKGWPDKDGGQMFFYPDLTDVECFDPDTDEPIDSPRFKTKTFTLLPDSEETMRIFKFLQHFQFESKDWYRWAGLRSHVEGNNQHMKDDAHADLGSPKKRRPRGYAF
jgi:hypothetical protein